MATKLDIRTAIPATGAAFALGGALVGEGPALAPGAPEPIAAHFHPGVKAPSPHSLRAIEAAKATLPFDDTRDFDEQARRLIAERAALEAARR